ncbi:MAG TPA: hypothetical protein VHM28_01535 [Anaerolineales bacterium]|nr:hypothetical protein [Anaerolineales bacterium]
MKHLRLGLGLLILLLSGCDVFMIRPAPYTISTPFSTRTPSIYSPTPIILAPPFTATSTPIGSIPSQITPTSTPPLVVTLTDTPTASTVQFKVIVEVLGCNTSIDITHGMGEVTNAYVTISNYGASDLQNVCATLRALDEGRPHPDKTKCVASLPAHNQVTQKLTVDSTYKEATPIQVDVSSNNELLSRVGEQSCKDLGLFPPNIEDLGTVTPIP